MAAGTPSVPLLLAHTLLVRTDMDAFALLTLNAFGVPTPGVLWRLRTLAAELERSDYDVVCLQEVQLHPFRRMLTEATPSFPSAVFAPHVHAPRGGLLTLTRPEIVRSSFIPYRERSIPAFPAVMDWLLLKGVLRTELRCNGRTVVVLNTHVNANYSGDWSRENAYAQVERRQLAQLAELAAAEPADSVVIVAGDLNVPRASWLYEALLAEGGLVDPLIEDTRPTYRIFPGLSAIYSQAVDFALVRQPAAAGVEIEAALRFEAPVAGAGGARYISDHLGVELRIRWKGPAPKPALSTRNDTGVE